MQVNARPLTYDIPKNNTWIRQRSTGYHGPHIPSNGLVALSVTQTTDLQSTADRQQHGIEPPGGANMLPVAFPIPTMSARQEHIVGDHKGASGKAWQQEIEARDVKILP
jgi:hypothetical protein